MTSANLQLITGEVYCLVPQPLLKTVQGWTLLVTRGGGGTFRMHLFDVQVFNPHAPLNRHHNFASKCAYKQRVQEVEHGSFTPLVLPLTGGPSNPAPICYKRLASMLFTKHEQLYSSAIAFLLHSSIQCTIGAHTSGGHAHVYKSKYLMSISILIPVFFLLIHTR